MTEVDYTFYIHVFLSQQCNVTWQMSFISNISNLWKCFFDVLSVLIYIWWFQPCMQIDSLRYLYGYLSIYILTCQIYYIWIYSLNSNIQKIFAYKLCLFKLIKYTIFVFINTLSLKEKANKMGSSFQWEVFSLTKSVSYFVRISHSKKNLNSTVDVISLKVLFYLSITYVR